LARADAAPDESDENNLIVANYVPDDHFTRTVEFQIDGAIEKPRNARMSVDGVGSAARFAYPTGVVADRRGNLFIVDQAGSVIRKVTPAGEVSTFAGAAQEKGRNDGPGRDARFNVPHGIAIDSADDLFVADTGNGLIRKITPAGIVSTITVRDDAQGGEAPMRLKSPIGVVWTSDGTLYVIDQNVMAGEAGGSIVRKIAPNGVVSNVAGPGDRDDGPAGIEAQALIESQSSNE
jgi:DNA-binding beta-propeller fold protein YncE